MDWLKNFILNLPFDFISEVIAKLVIWWSWLTASVPDNELPLMAYLGSSIIVLVLLLFVVRVLPKPVGGILWVLAVAMLLTPGETAVADAGGVAPAIAGVAYGVLMGDISGAMFRFLPILAVFIALLCVGAIWQVLHGLFDARMKDKVTETPSKK